MANKCPGCQPDTDEERGEWHTLSGWYLRMALAMGCGSPRSVTLPEALIGATKLSFPLAA